MGGGYSLNMSFQNVCNATSLKFKLRIVIHFECCINKKERIICDGDNKQLKTTYPNTRIIRIVVVEKYSTLTIDWNVDISIETTSDCEISISNNQSRPVKKRRNKKAMFTSWYIFQRLPHILLYMEYKLGERIISFKYYADKNCWEK